MKKRRTIGIKINIFLVLMILLVAAVTTIISYFINSSQVDQHFSDINLSICRTVLNLTDKDFISTMAEKVQTEEYRQLYDKAVEEEDDTAIIEWLKKEGLYDQYMSTLKMMEDFQKDMNVEYIYYWTCTGHWSYAIMDPKEDFFYLGL